MRGDFSTVVLFHQGQGQIDAGGYTARGVNRAVADKDLVGFHFDGRILASQALRVIPMGSDAAALQQTTRGQQERARADRD